VALFALFALLVLMTSGGGWVLFGLFRIVLVVWLVSTLVRIASGYRRGHRWH
jgi:hypothetical protein